MKPSLQLKLSQHLALTPQLQQSIKLLQLSTLELNQEIEHYLLENPLLEREDDYEPSPPPTDAGFADAPGGALPNDRDEADARGEREEAADPGDSNEFSAENNAEGSLDDGWFAEGSYPSGSRDNDGDDEGDGQDIQAATTSLKEHLTWQLGLIPLSDRDRSLACFLVEALDDDGYLDQSLEELGEALPAELEVEPEELEIALKHIHNLEPTGVGARSPQECLALQLKARPAEPLRNLALTLVEKYLDLLASRDFTRLKRQLGCDDDTLKAVQILIMGLNPRPGAQYAPLETRYIVPDVIVRKVRNQWVASINPDAFPRLRVNRLYADLLQKHRTRGDGGGMSGQLQEARWLIKNVQQRFDTILRVSQAIVDRQRAFFDHGEVAMRPLVLREIAEILDLHESTVSRVTTQKYMASPRGIFELKYFFGSHVATDTGGACSATAIRALIKQLVGSENAKKPLSDNQIADILGQQGIVVARRTIAKYREGMGIPAANLRKSL